MKIKVLKITKAKMSKFSIVKEIIKYINYRSILDDKIKNYAFYGKIANNHLNDNSKIIKFNEAAKNGIFGYGALTALSFIEFKYSLIPTIIARTMFEDAELLSYAVFYPNTLLVVAITYKMLALGPLLYSSRSLLGFFRFYNTNKDVMIDYELKSKKNN